MRLPLISWCFGTAILFFLAHGAQGQAPNFKMVQLDPKFNSEGVTVADVNNDGKLDVITGEFWYEAPSWRARRIRPAKTDYKDGLGSYSDSFVCWAEDYNKDGWVDIGVICFPGEPCYWLENPKGEEKLWTRHEIWDSACNETPMFTDLFKDGKKVLLMGFQPKGSPGNMGQMGWFAPGSDPSKKWDMHPISVPSEKGKEVPGTQKFSHGLGVGDINGDGRNDVICTGGWWEQPKEGREAKGPWKFHPANLGQACADMVVIDVDGDGLNDIICSSAHKYGIWAHIQRKGGEHPVFTQQVLFPQLVSETHALQLVDLDHDGILDVVTGKRWWSHGRSEPGSDQAPTINFLKGSRNSSGEYVLTPMVIATGSGVGTQFQVTDLDGNGRLDVITSNKKGVFIHLQENAKKPEKEIETPRVEPKPAVQLTPKPAETTSPVPQVQNVRTRVGSTGQRHGLIWKLKNALKGPSANPPKIS